MVNVIIDGVKTNLELLLAEFNTKRKAAASAFGPTPTSREGWQVYNQANSALYNAYATQLDLARQKITEVCYTQLPVGFVPAIITTMAINASYNVMTEDFKSTAFTSLPTYRVALLVSRFRDLTNTLRFWVANRKLNKTESHLLMQMLDVAEAYIECLIAFIKETCVDDYVRHDLKYYVTNNSVDFSKHGNFIVNLC